MFILIYVQYTAFSNKMSRATFLDSDWSGPPTHSQNSTVIKNIRTLTSDDFVLMYHQNYKGINCKISLAINKFTYTFTCTHIN